MVIKAIMCDVDGTLLNDEGYVSPFTIEMIKKAKEQGILFGLCTGRDVDSVKTLLETWGVNNIVDIIVGTGGAEIYDYILGIDKSNYPLDGALIQDIINHYEGMDLNFAIPYEGILYAPKDDKYIQMLSYFDKVPYKVVDFKEVLKEPKSKVMIVCDEGYMEKVIEKSKTFHNENYKSASLKTASVLYEYMDSRVTKTNGLIEALKMHDLSLDELCVFGDADNDYDMVKNAAMGVVMANGSEKTKSAANYITEDNNHDGVGNFISKILEGTL